MPVPIAEWNPARCVWETGQGQLCGHLAVFSETWPTSGMTRGGVAYELPTWAHHTDDSESSLLPSPSAADGNGGGRSNSPGHQDTLPGTVRLLPTPEAKLSDSGPDYARANQPGSGGDDLITTLHNLLPTPTSRDHKDTGNFTPHPEKIKLPHTIATLGVRTGQQSDAGSTASGE